MSATVCGFCLTAAYSSMISSAATTFCCIVLLSQTSQARKSDQGAYISLIIQIYVNAELI